MKLMTKIIITTTTAANDILATFLKNQMFPLPRHQIIAFKQNEDRKAFQYLFSPLLFLSNLK